jgi:hypothetical protein
MQIGRVNRSFRRKPVSVPSTTNPTWLDTGSNPDRRGGKPATNSLSYGASKKCVSYLYTKSTYILKLLLNEVTAGIEALVSGNTFSYACVNEVFRLWPQPRYDIIHQLFCAVIATSFSGRYG